MFYIYSAWWFCNTRLTNLREASTKEIAIINEALTSNKEVVYDGSLSLVEIYDEDFNLVFTPWITYSDDGCGLRLPLH